MRGETTRALGRELAEDSAHISWTLANERLVAVGFAKGWDALAEIWPE